MARTGVTRMAVAKAETVASQQRSPHDMTPRFFPIQPPELTRSIAPKGVKPPVMAMDNECYQYAGQLRYGRWTGFPGYPYLAQLATRAEFRQFAATYSTELTRAGITVSHTNAKDKQAQDRVQKLTQHIKDTKLMDNIQKAASEEYLYGRGQIMFDVRDQSRELPLILNPRTVRKDSFRGFSTVEAMWTTPAEYNAIDPFSPSFYRPTKWYALGQVVHSSRLQTIITRPLPDMLKPAYNFGGISMSQLAEAYVDSWLQTKTSVGNLLDKYSITALKTNMSTVLNGTSNGENVITRAQLFTTYRSNLGLMLLDYDKEDLVQLNTPLSELSALQAQSQEHMCSVSHTPAIILTGVEPAGLNANSEGSVKIWNQWIGANQESFWRTPIDNALKLLQLDLWGFIDPDITFVFNPLIQMTQKELAEIRKSNADAAAVYIDRQVIAPEEERERLAHDVESGYHGLSTDVIPEMKEDDEEDSLLGGSPDSDDADAESGASDGEHGKRDAGVPVQ